MRVYGPVPSRRLGRSLGVNNIPYKICPYSCVYCQIGRTNRLHTERRIFYQPEEIVREVEDKIEKHRNMGEHIDYISFVPDGEPTLDKNLGAVLQSVKSLGIKTAVITNASLIWREDVREDLFKADLVSLKVDAVTEGIWKRINRPRGTLELQRILQGSIDFAGQYDGICLTETMLVKGVNDDKDSISEIADFLARLKPDRAYISIPTRPPAEKGVYPPGEETVNLAYNVFSGRLGDVEYLIGYEGNAFAYTGNVEEDLLSITSVHPMREEAVREFLSKAGTGWDTVEELISRNKLVKLQYEGKVFFMRKLNG